MTQQVLNSKLMQLANVASKVNDPHYKTCVVDLQEQVSRRSTELFMF